MGGACAGASSAAVSANAVGLEAPRRELARAGGVALALALTCEGCGLAQRDCAMLQRVKER